ncbi:dUTP diphosphatase [Cytobacillus sp. FSL R5-0569]|uniref:dUTP diphosphatase n=1 Tax=Cytobacillus sp. FSL R5-0569 TaxID=2921649 RepID=UPI0030FCD987
MLDLIAMYEAQKAFRNRIDYKGDDRYGELTLALQVELGECANELPKVFKFWAHKENNLQDALIEYADGLHFILDIGHEIFFEDFDMIYLLSGADKGRPIATQFRYIFALVSKLDKTKSSITFIELLSEYIGLGEMIGFSFEQVEEAFYVKDVINHERQSECY